MNVKDLSIYEKVGQRFILGINSNNIDLIIEMIKKYYIGGVILYKKNYCNYNEMLDVIKKLKQANSGNKIPLFIAIDQEGGRVNRMPSEFRNLRNIYDVSYKDFSLMYSYGNITGKMLYSMGINMNFAPVLDIFQNHSSKLLYKRCFYGDIDDINNCSTQYIKGITDSGVIPVVKHFPGHGISKSDSHFMVPYVFNYKDIIDRHIKPFENAINSGINALMVGHLVIRRMTNGLPASISNSFISKYIREEYNYDDLVITDEVNMLSRNIFYGFGRIKKAFLSGSDIVLVKLSKRNKKLVDKCVKMVLKNDKYLDMLDDNVNRILRIKEKYKIVDDILYDGCDLVAINKGIDEINKLCT